MTEPAATDRGTISGPASSGPGASGPAADSSAGLAGGLSVVHRVRRRDPVPLGAGLFIAVAGGLVLAIMDGSYLGLTVTTGVAYAVVTVGMVLQLGYSRQLAFSQSVFMGVGAYGTGVLETKYNFSSLESLLAVIALAAVAAFLVGAVVTRAPGLALALATLLLPLFTYQLATFSSWLGSFSGIDGVAPAGRKSVAGAILGAIVIEYLTTSTSFISTNLGIIEGIALLLILLVEPDGVAGAVDRFLGRAAVRRASVLRSQVAGRLRSRGGGSVGSGAGV